MSTLTKKIIIYISIAIGLLCIGFCAGRFARLGRIERDSNGIKQRIDNIGDATASAGTSIENGIGFINSGLAFTDIAIRNINGATILNIQLQSKIDELVGITQAYQDSLQLANATINDLLDLSIRRAELDEEFIRSVIELSGTCKQSSTEQ